MIVEEKKAAEFICPHLTEWRQKCEGSRCMAWRWADNIIKHNKLELADGKSTTHGYCGLGGRP